MDTININTCRCLYFFEHSPSTVTFNDFPKICRLCLDECSENVKITNLYNCKYNDSLIIELVHKLVSSIEVDSEDIGMPANVCSRCIKVLISYNSFVECCKSSNDILKNVANKIKRENRPRKCRIKNRRNIMDRIVIEAEFDSDSNANEDNLNSDTKTSLFQNESDLNHRVNDVHSIKEEQEENENLISLQIYSCTDCELGVFENKAQLNQHRKLQHSSRTTNKKPRHVTPAQCDICGKLFNSVVTMAAHKRFTHHGVIRRKKHACPHCPKRFVQRQQCLDHANTHTGVRPYKCNVATCNRYFKSRSNLQRHTDVVHNKQKTYKCHVCGKSVAQKVELQTHLKSHSRETDVLLQCNDCPATFNHRLKLNAHIRHVHHPTHFNCDQCKRVLLTEIALKIHQSHMHRKLSPDDPSTDRNNCTVAGCNRQFTTAAGLRVHVKNAHERGEILSNITAAETQPNLSTSTKPIVTCEVCGKTFHKRLNLRVHMRVHSDERPHVCTLCGKAFKQHAHLRYHTLSHQGIKSYKCTVCEKAFTSSGTLTVHKRSHTGEMPYRCGECQRGFYDSSALRKHTRVHHKQREIVDKCLTNKHS